MTKAEFLEAINRLKDAVDSGIADDEDIELIGNIVGFFKDREIIQLKDSLSARDVVIEKMDKALGGIINVHMSCEQPTIHQEDECHEMFMLAQKALEISLPAATEELRNLREAVQAAKDCLEQLKHDGGHSEYHEALINDFLEILAKLGGGK